MKLLLGLLGFLSLAALGLPLMVAAVLATHPWLAVGVTFVDNRPQAVKSGVPSNQWPSIVDVAKQSTCSVSAEDLAAVARLKGLPINAIASVAETLCALGYSVDRTRALDTFGGPAFGASVTRLAATLEAPSTIVQRAEGWLGVPYAFGGCSKSGIDCSCLVQRVFESLGINLPRTAADQYAATIRVGRDQLQPGDLVFFANTYMPGVSHVGIYIGGGQQVNAPTEGQAVSIQPVFDGYWGAHYFGAGRVFS